MKAIGFAGYSGAGKTTVLEQIIRVLRERGVRVSVVKHAHHDVDVDVPGKDSWRHRKAGAFEVLLVTEKRMALMREFDEPREDLSVHDMLAELDPSVDWVIVEGFKQSELPKIEIWREPAAGDKPRTLRYPGDAAILAIATDDASCLPRDCTLPVLDLNDPAKIVQWMLANGARFEYAEYAPTAPNNQENLL